MFVENLAYRELTKHSHTVCHVFIFTDSAFIFFTLVPTFSTFSLWFHNISVPFTAWDIQHFYTAFFETLHIHIWLDELPCCYDCWQRRVTLGLWFFQLMSKHVPLPRATHSKTALDGLSLLCSAQHLMPAVVRSSLQVWPQGLCLCNYL